MAKNTVTIIIPALNEEKTISHTVAESLKAANVSEVLVIDDKSIDRTASLARQAGARVITSEIRGKGASMRDGFMAAKGDIIVFVDADIKTFSAGMVDAITAPILDNRCDFVKSSYGRKSGRVTELLCKPMLSQLFPPLVSFRQPLSGIIGGKKKFFSNVRFENDYGVDVGILIDMVNSGARIMEVDIGYVDHKMKSWRGLGKMANEVARSIIKRASITNEMVQNGIFAEASIIKGMLSKGPEIAFPMEKVAFLDIDGTIARDSFIYSFAEENGFTDRLKSVVSSAQEPYARTCAIAMLMRGFRLKEVSVFARRLNLSENAAALVAALRRKGYLTVLVTDTYESVAYQISKRVGADRVIANRLHWEDGVCTGEVTVNPMFLPFKEACTQHPICKLTAAMRFCRMHNIDFEKTFAVGNSENDVCLLRFANESYAYKPESMLVASSAKRIIRNLLEASGQ